MQFRSVLINRLFLVTLLLLTVSLDARADQFFRELREDKTLPTECREFKLDVFSGPMDLVFIGIEGSKSKGFTHEYPLERRDASLLWVAAKALAEGKGPNRDVLEKIESDSDMLRDWRIIQENYKAMGFDFGNEGEVLELLGLVDLRRDYPESQYFHTGGVEYHEAGSSSTMGELDVLVGRRSDCKIVVFGEAKLGNTLSKARKQMARFAQFLRKNGIGSSRTFAESIAPLPSFNKAAGF